MTVYYNEIDPYAAQWLRNLIAAGHIAPGDVDERSIIDVQPEDLRGYAQCHFFAGIGVWSHALRRAGWADDRPVWTGSCPCQPFSAAGAQRGSEDERHLWPAWFRLIRECRPATVFGEQVAGGAGLAWLDHVCADLEDHGYAVGAADLCAAGAGAPHIRQRLYFVGNSAGGRSLGAIDGTKRDAGSGQKQSARGMSLGFVADARNARGQRGAYARTLGGTADADQGAQSELGGSAQAAGDGGASGFVADAGSRSSIRGESVDHGTSGRDSSTVRCSSKDGVGDIGHAASSRCERRPIAEGTTERRIPVESLGGRAINGFWSDAEWIWCRDGKYRPTQPGLFPLAHGATVRVGRLRAYGNAIVAPLAEQFIRAAS